ncbi:MAG: hypothetical protein IJ794_02805 [Lachnospiraceae bacterium]|nr:hypothetical protein [Lachnospiraceae bacterium]
MKKRCETIGVKRNGIKRSNGATELRRNEVEKGDGAARQRNDEIKKGAGIARQGNDEKVGFQLWLMLSGVVGIGVFQSLLVEVHFGTDTCAFMNLALAGRVGWSLGLCMILSNVLLFILELLFGRKLIGAGTVANMLLVGMVSDLCRSLERRWLPAWVFGRLGSRVGIFVIALVGFLISVALYMNADMGQTPYDAIPTIISERMHIPYAWMRITWDSAVAVLGVLLGGRLTAGNVILAMTIGPAVGIVGKWLEGEKLRGMQNPRFSGGKQKQTMVGCS